MNSISDYFLPRLTHEIRSQIGVADLWQRFCRDSRGDVRPRARHRSFCTTRSTPLRGHNVPMWSPHLGGHYVTIWSTLYIFVYFSAPLARPVPGAGGRAPAGIRTARATDGSRWGALGGDLLRRWGTCGVLILVAVGERLGCPF